MIARFKREARLTARFEHPGVPAVFDVGDHDGLLYLVMQLIDGVDLAAVLDARGALPVDWAVAVGAQIATVLAAAHAVSLVHRDLKPRNVMLSRGGVVRVLDFGVAALLDPDLTRVTVVGETVGSPAYMSPEQITSGTVSPRSDLYALGCVLHELVAGEEPFPAATTAAQMYAHLEREPRYLRERAARAARRRRAARRGTARQGPRSTTVRCGRGPGAAAAVPSRDRCACRPERSPRSDLSLPPPAGTPAVPPVMARPAATISEPLAHVGVGRRSTSPRTERFTQAAELLSRRLRGAAEPPAELLNARLQLAHALLLGGEYRRALPEFDAVATTLIERDGPDDVEVLRCRVQIATCRAELGELTAAIAELNDVLERWNRLGDTGLEVLDLRRQVALLLASSGDLAAAGNALGELAAGQGTVVGCCAPRGARARRSALPGAGSGARGRN